MIKVIVNIIIIFLISFLGLEIILRLADPLGVEYFSEVEKYFQTHVTKENYSYIHPAGMEKDFQGVTIKTNSYGLRGPELSRTKPENTRRILILGDSVVLGWGVEYEKTFPALIQDMYGADDNIEVIPAGVSSWNTRTEYEYLKRVALNFEPDAVILIIVSNDTDPKENSNIQIGKEELDKLVYRPNTDQDIFHKTWFFLVERSYFFKHLQFMVKVMTERDQNAGTSKKDLTWQDTELALKNMTDLCARNNTKFFPFLFADSKTALEHPIYSLYSSYLKETGTKYYTFPEKLFKGYEYKNSVVDNHPNSEGHAIIAQKLYEVLQKEFICP
ncbi:MAG: SGNH/GDSL hydrolase family protein [Candidatus Delongbacteria bacterium]